MKIGKKIKREWVLIFDENIIAMKSKQGKDIIGKDQHASWS